MKYTPEMLRTWLEKATKLYLDEFPEKDPVGHITTKREEKAHKWNRNIECVIIWYLKALSGKKIKQRDVYALDFENGNFPIDLCKIQHLNIFVYLKKST